MKGNGLATCNLVMLKCFQHDSKSIKQNVPDLLWPAKAHHLHIADIVRITTPPSPVIPALQPASLHAKRPENRSSSLAPCKGSLHDSMELISGGPALPVRQCTSEITCLSPQLNLIWHLLPWGESLVIAMYNLVSKGKRWPLAKLVFPLENTGGDLMSFAEPAMYHVPIDEIEYPGYDHLTLQHHYLST